MIETPYTYLGSELDVFQHAVNWKRYWGTRIRPYLGASVLEVGAGIGGTTRVLFDDRYASWTGLEPDVAMVEQLREQQAQGDLPAKCDFRLGDISMLAADELFDSIIYIDVLEHIERDVEELIKAAEHLKPGGHLIVLSPAFQYLYTAFDHAIGHYRRYTRAALREITPPGCQVRQQFYLDAVGMMASLANKWLLKKPDPSLQQILFWDRVLVPLARVVDPLTGYAFGRSVISVWQRSG
ncbi:MAG: class I SAM-dependent methyltransferase [Anaerolineae bacterium]|nr:class I SAM-dependent methyltransferase [Anaerolineae bacterium]